MKTAARNIARVLSAGTLLVGTLIGVSGNGWAEEAGIGVELGPAKVERDLATPAISQDFLIVNHESAARSITMTVAGLGHDLDGAPQFLEPAAATSALQLSESAFTLDSGEKKTVHLAGAMPSGARSLYAGVIAEFAPLTPAKGAVESRSRVASLLLYRGPKPWVEKTSILDVGLQEQEGTKQLKVFASLKNIGNVHVRPSGSVKISHEGKELATVQLASQLIIPDFARKLTALWTPPEGINGRLTLELNTSDGGRKVTSDTISKGIVTANTAGKIQNLRGRNSEGGLVTLDVVNTGTNAVRPSLTLITTESGAERSRVVLPQPNMPAGKSVSVEWKPKLAKGLYVVIAQLYDGDALLDQTITALPVGIPGADASQTDPGNAAKGGPKHSVGGFRWKAVLTPVSVVLAGFALAWARMNFLRRRKIRTQSVPVQTIEPSEEWRRASGL